MKPEPNNEIDLLLRQLARRDGAPVSEIPHLDADELNSYVANALPVAARARYTEHLADCSSCRKLVTQLSVAQGPVAAKESVGVAAPAGVKSFLASLFSPMVLRYAVPALGLIVIAVVGIVVFRQDKQGNSIARVSEADRSKSVAVSTPVAETTITPNAPLADSSAGTNKTEVPQRTVVAPVGKDAPAPAANQPADPVTTAEAPPPAPKAAGEEARPAAEPEKLKKAEKLAEQTAAAARDAAKQRADEANKNEVQKYDSVTATPSSGPPGRAEVRSAKTGAATGTTGGVASVDSGPDSPRKREEAKQGVFSSAETRSVAGRRFGKSSRGWIDTAYNSSSAVVNVARGSEQYRALVADEPSIRTIAEELDGEIIVVWKGRTYRIR